MNQLPENSYMMLLLVTSYLIGLGRPGREMFEKSQIPMREI